MFSNAKRFPFFVGLLPLVAFFFFFLQPNTVHAAIITATGFELNGKTGSEVTASSTTNAPDMENSVLSRGAGINATALANSYAATAFVVGGNKASAIASNEFFQVTLQSKNCVFFSLQKLNFNLRRSGTGPNAYQWQYSLDGFATPGTDVGAEGSYTGTGTNGAAMPEIDLSAITALQDIPSGTPVTFRLYAWGATAAAGTLAIGRLAGNDLSFTAQFGPDNLLEYEMNGQTGDQVTTLPSSKDGCINSADMTRGDGLNPTALANSYASNGFTVNGTENDALANHDYIQILIDVKDGNRVNLYELNYNIRRSAQGPNTFQWQYSLDEFSTSGTDLGAAVIYNGTDALGVAQTPIDLNSIAELQTVKKVTLRLYAWGATSGAGTFAIGRLPGPDLQISGTISRNSIISFKTNVPVFGFPPPPANLGSLNAFYTDTNLENTSLSRGAGITAVDLGTSYISSDFDVGADKAAAILNNEYYEVSAQAKVGYYINFSGIFQYNIRTVSGPSSYQWQYSLDGFSTPGIDIGGPEIYTGTDVLGLGATNTSPYNIPELQNVTSVTFRLYAWDATAATGTYGFGQEPIYDLYFSGEVYIYKNFVNYSAAQGGYLSGSSTQLVDYGSSTLAVTAVPYNGNKFTQWSDGSTDNPRFDVNVTNTKSFTAYFEAIQSTSTTAGAGGFVPPSGKGTGIKDFSLEINELGSIGTVDDTGINLLAKIGSQARFILAKNSLYSYTLSLDTVDLTNKRIVFRILGTSQSADMLMGETRIFDFNADGVGDLSVQFFDVYINRIELVLKQLTTSYITEQPQKDSATVTDNEKKSISKQAYRFVRELRTGMTGEDVKQLQVFLNNNGFPISKSGPGSLGKETTRFGAFTRDALTRFQQANNILATGILGPITRNLINTILLKTIN